MSNEKQTVRTEQRKKKKYMYAMVVNERNRTHAAKHPRERQKKNIARTDTIKHFVLDFVQAIKIRIKHSPKSSRMSIGQSEAKQKQKQQSIKRTEFTSGDFILYLSLYGFFFIPQSNANEYEKKYKIYTRKHSCTIVYHQRKRGECVCWCVCISKQFFVRAFEAPLLCTVHVHRKKPSCVSSLLYTKPNQKNQANFSCVNNSVNLMTMTAPNHVGSIRMPKPSTIVYMGFSVAVCALFGI